MVQIGTTSIDVEIQQQQEYVKVLQYVVENLRNSRDDAESRYQEMNTKLRGESEKLARMKGIVESSSSV